MFSSEILSGQNDSEEDINNINIKSARLEINEKLKTFDQ